MEKEQGQNPAEQQGLRVSLGPHGAGPSLCKKPPECLGWPRPSPQAQELMRAPTGQAQNALPTVGVHPAWFPGQTLLLSTLARHESAL